MKSIKNFLSIIDIFGVTYTFRYKEREKYGTSLGGFFIILLLILVLVMGIYYFIPFINRKNYTIVYYTMNLATTEEVNLFESNSNIAVGITCEANNKEKRNVYDLLDLKLNFIQYEKFRDGTYGKIPKEIQVDICNYEDFYNKFDKQFDYLGMKDFYCVKNKEFTIQGIYADRIFSYYEFSVVAKNKSEELITEIERFLFENDCKLQFVYTDIIIDLDSYEEPIAQYLDEIFIQLNPVLFIKRNIFFRNQYFTNDNFLMFVFGDDEIPETKPLYSRYEEYSLYKGLERSKTQPKDFDYFTKVYVRADLKKTIIKRKYQKFMEFYADASSLLIAIYEILAIIFNFVDTYYAQYSLAKKIFFFKDLENETGFNVSKKIKEINELIYKIDPPGEQNKITDIRPFEIQSKGSRVIKNFPPKKVSQDKIPVNKDENTKKINIYNNRKKPLDIKYSNNIKRNALAENKINLRQPNEKNEEKYDESNEENEDTYQRYKMNKMRKNVNNSIILNFKSKHIEDNQISDSNDTNIEESESSSENDRPKKKKNRKIKVSNSFNIFEIIITQFFKCCMTKSMRIKNDVYEKAYTILFSKMDVNTYVRNMILFDIINQTILDENKKIIINFLCRPTICNDKKQKNNLPIFYKKYKDKDFNKFCETIEQLNAQEKKDENEKNLINISNEYLKAYI